MIVLVVLMLVLPSITNRKRQKEYNEMIEHLCVGDQIKTIGGIVGRINKINKKEEGTTVILETGSKGSKTTMEIDAGAIGTVLKSNYVAPIQPNDSEKNKKKKENPVVEQAAESVEVLEPQEIEKKEEDGESVVENVESQVLAKKQTKKNK